MADAAENSTDQTGPSMPVLVDAFRQLRLSSPGPEGKETKCLLYGLLPEMVGDMLTLGDCSRGDILRVAGLIYSLPIDDITEKSRCGFLKAFSIPTYQTIFEAMKHEPEARVIVNFACSQSVCHSSSAFMSLPSIKAIVVVASDLPERVSYCARMCVERWTRWLIPKFACSESPAPVRSWSREARRGCWPLFSEYHHARISQTFE